ncbi:MAG: Usg family protein [Rhodospirillales bacterium]|nr:Usg family protein [Rhodospirillales bacterium]MCB9965586.1 Usg family protein [Rhodospirillales bacterium]MCB9979827.1 Usg family protein [Rhodospirillales bacterium]
MANLDLQLQGFRLTTAQIYYYFPDYPRLIQEFLWQDYDLAPRFPKLQEFLTFWKKDIEGTLHSVYISHQKLIGLGEITHSTFEEHL